MYDIDSPSVNNRLDINPPPQRVTRAGRLDRGCHPTAPSESRFISHLAMTAHLEALPCRSYLANGIAKGRIGDPVDPRSLKGAPKKANS